MLNWRGNRQIKCQTSYRGRGRGTCARVQGRENSEAARKRGNSSRSRKALDVAATRKWGAVLQLQALAPANFAGTRGPDAHPTRPATLLLDQSSVLVVAWLMDSTAMKASWGTSTLPRLFIRFLPAAYDQGGVGEWVGGWEGGKMAAGCGWRN